VFGLKKKVESKKGDTTTTANFQLTLLTLSGQHVRTLQLQLGIRSCGSVSSKRSWQDFRARAGGWEMWRGTRYFSANFGGKSL